MKLKREFFNRDTVVVAQELLGKYLVRKINGKIVKFRITETEAYCGSKDLACHASKGMTPRTKVMFGPPGHAYIYLIYGMYYCLNIVTEKEGYPAAVLIRAVGRGPAYRVPKECLGAHSGTPHTSGTQPQSFRAAGVPSRVTPTSLNLNGPGKLCRGLEIDRGLDGVDVCKSKELWLQDGGKIEKIKIKKSKRIGVDYAGKWKDKLWRFYL